MHARSWNWNFENYYFVIKSERNVGLQNHVDARLARISTLCTSEILIWFFWVWLGYAKIVHVTFEKKILELSVSGRAWHRAITFCQIVLLSTSNMVLYRQLKNDYILLKVTFCQQATADRDLIFETVAIENYRQPSGARISSVCIEMTKTQGTVQYCSRYYLDNLKRNENKCMIK